MTTMTLDTMFTAPTRSRAVRCPPAPVRLTRRGRLVVVVAALLVAFAIGVFVTAAGSVATQRPAAPSRPGSSRSAPATRSGTSRPPSPTTATCGP